MLPLSLTGLSQFRWASLLPYLCVCGSYRCCDVTRLRPGHQTGLSRHFPGWTRPCSSGHRQRRPQSGQAVPPSSGLQALPPAGPGVNPAAVAAPAGRSPSLEHQDLLLPFWREGPAAASEERDPTPCEPGPWLSPRMEEPVFLPPHRAGPVTPSGEALWGLGDGGAALVPGAGPLGQGSVLTPL